MSSVYFSFNEPEIRMVLVGKTGTGKSAVGNTILRKNVLVSRPSTSSVTSECQKKTGHFDGQRLSVVDTPGLFDTKKSNKQILTEVARCISMAAPGPHVFLIVLQIGRFTKEEQDTVKIIQSLFGEEASKYTMALFTHGDLLGQLETKDPMESMIKDDEVLSDFLKKCQGGYHVFDNIDKNPAQVRELLQKINKILKKNGETFYTNEMFKEAEKANSAEMEKLLKEHPGMDPEVAREQAERDNPFIRNVARGFSAGIATGAATGAAAGAATGAATGASIGAGIGLVAGPLGVGLGAGLGAAVGTAVGTVTGAAAGAGVVVAVARASKNKHCIVQ